MRMAACDLSTPASQAHFVRPDRPLVRASGPIVSGCLDRAYDPAVPRSPDATPERVVLVTGATSGIGLETARALARGGALVVLGVRDPVRGQAVADEIERGGGRAEVLPIDLASLASVREAVRRFLEAHRQLDVLINNAKVALRAQQVTADGHERT